MLLGGEQGEIVVGLDDLERLDEDGLAGTGTVVDDAGQPRPGGGQDGQTVAVVAQHDDRVAQDLAPLSQDLFEAARDLAPPAAQLRAGGGKRGRGVVAQAAFGREQLASPFQEGVESGEPQPSRGQQRRLDFGQGAAHRLTRAGESQDRPELFGRSQAARGGELRQDGRHVLDAGQGQAPVAQAQGGGLGGLRGKMRDALGCRSGKETEESCFSGRRSGEGGNQPEDDVELERLPVDVVLRRRRGDGYGVARRSSESLRSIFLRAWIALRLRLALGFS